MTSSSARRGTGLRAGPPGLVAATRRRNRRLDWLLLRWQARLDASWADRLVPWVLALGLFAVYTSLALARIDRLDAGVTLGRYVQGAWHLSEGRAPELTIGGEGNLFAAHLPVLFVPLAALTRLLPAAGTLVVAQAGALAVGIVPVWLLARRVARLRVGAAGALAFVYACHPALADLDLADFNPQAMALAPLLAAFYFSEQRQWRWFAVASAFAVLWSSDLGLVIAAFGVVLWLEGERRVGWRAGLVGLGWSLLALLAVQSPLGHTGLVAPGAFRDYGDGGFEVLVGLLRNPLRPAVELVSEANVELLAWVLGPLLFLPLAAFRKLLPALPLTALVLIADVPATGTDGGARTVPLLAVAFVATAFALVRLGRPSVERVIVDRRLLGILTLAALAATATTSPLSPYERPWSVDGDREEAHRAALAVLPPVVAVRVPPALVTDVAERTTVQVLDPDERDPMALTRGVDALVLDEARYDDLDAAERHALRRAVELHGMVQVGREGGLATFVRILEDGVLVPSRLPERSSGP